MPLGLGYKSVRLSNKVEELSTYLCHMLRQCNSSSKNAFFISFHVPNTKGLKNMFKYLVINVAYKTKQTLQNALGNPNDRTEKFE